jgi:hypothetical protein
MVTCKDCIHFKICNNYVYLVGRETKVACNDYKSTEDVVPRSEVEKAKQEVAEQIFEEIDTQLAFFQKHCFSNTTKIILDVIAELKKKYTGEQS